jgi:Arc/MetJ family transcription regulator
MKTTIDIPEEELADAMRYAGVATKREAVVTAIREYNQRRRMAALSRHAGTSDTFESIEQLNQKRNLG